MLDMIMTSLCGILFGYVLAVITVKDLRAMHSRPLHHTHADSNGYRTADPR